MTRADTGGLADREEEQESSSDEKLGARRPEHGGETASLPTKGKNPEPKEEEDAGDEQATHGS